MNFPSFHRAAAFAALPIMALSTGCGSETISAAGPVTEYTVVLDVPGTPISAAVGRAGYAARTNWSSWSRA